MSGGSGIKRRSTAQKQVILDTLRELGSHVSAGAVYARLRETHPGIGRATVYRVLSDMAEDGLLLRIHTGGADDKFDVTVRPHWHMTCRICGKVADAELDLEPQELLDHVTGAAGFKLDGVNAELLGICPACQAACQAKMAEAAEEIPSDEESGGEENSL